MAAAAACGADVMDDDILPTPKGGVTKRKKLRLFTGGLGSARNRIKNSVPTIAQAPITGPVAPHSDRSDPDGFDRLSVTEQEALQLQFELHPLKKYLESEVKTRLATLDSHLEHVSTQVEHCERRCSEGLGELRMACEDLLLRLTSDGPQGVNISPAPFGAGAGFGAPLAARQGSFAGRQGSSLERTPSILKRGASALGSERPGSKEDRTSSQQDGSTIVTAEVREARERRSAAFQGEGDEMQPLLAKNGVWPAEEGDEGSGGEDSAEKEAKDKQELEREDSLDLIAKIANKGSVRRNPMVEAVTNFLDDPESGRLASLYDRMMPRLILMTVFVTLSQSVEPPALKGEHAVVLETIIDVFFTLEITMRIAFAPDRLKALKSVYNHIDILSAAPLGLRIFLRFQMPELDTDPRRYMLLCVVPVVRTVKVLRRFKQFQLLIRAFKGAFEALPVLLYTLSVIILTFSALIYMIEPHDNVTCLPEAVWLAIVTMTTVGYGDITPVSPLGTVVVSFLIILSTLYMAMPLGIIGYTFTQIWKDKDRILLMSITRERLDQWGYSARDIATLFKVVDDSGDGELDLDEFKDLVRKLRIGLQEHQTAMLFNFIDKDGGGTIDDEEFVRAVFPQEYKEIYQKAPRISRVGSSSNSSDGPQRTKSELSEPRRTSND